jgi:hypothetical protein
MYPNGSQYSPLPFLGIKRNALAMHWLTASILNFGEKKTDNVLLDVSDVSCLFGLSVIKAVASCCD